jgi:hypothetical protein
LTTPSAASLGKVRWKRFAAIMIPAAIGVGGLLTATANGAITSSFAYSGSNFLVTADSIDGTGFEQYGDTATPAGKSTQPVAISGFKTATIKNMCQQVSIGPFTLRLTAGTGSDPVKATDLVLSVTDLTAKSAEFGNIVIGKDASKLSGPQQGASGMFGQQADEAHLKVVRQTAWATTAGNFTLPDLNLGFGKTCG